MWTFVIFRQVLETLLIVFFPILFKLDNFYLSSLFTEPFLRHFHSAIEPTSEFLISWKFPLLNFSIWFFVVLMKISIFQFKNVLPYFLEHGCNIYVTVIILTSMSSQGYSHWFSFHLRFEIFLFLYMRGDFRLDPGHFEYYVIRFWVLFKTLAECHLLILTDIWPC